ncbi:MAG: hypothetical protein ACJAVI_005572 [Candidatus Azotimanducaceae bacterium]|jgi:hypothetical protein
MKKFTTLLLALSLFGCAGMFIESAPISIKQGDVRHMLTARYGGIEPSEASMIKAMNKRAKVICNGSFELVNEARKKVPLGSTELTREIRCL